MLNKNKDAKRLIEARGLKGRLKIAWTKLKA